MTPLMTPVLDRDEVHEIVVCLMAIELNPTMTTRPAQVKIRRKLDEYLDVAEKDQQS